MKNQEPEKPPNHERWIISYADFTTLLLATFVVMYAVSTINSSKFQQMAESFSTAFIGRTTHIQDTGYAAAQKSPFSAMPNPVHLPVITREREVKNQPPAMHQNEVYGDPKEKSEDGQYLESSGAVAPPQPQSATQAQVEAQAQAQVSTPAGRSESVNPSNPALRQQVEQRIEGLDAAYDKLTKALSGMIGKGQVHVALQSLGVVIDINEVLLFSSGKAELTPGALPLIDEISKILAGLNYQIQVNGFTDNVPIHTPQFDSNWDLSATRAISVVKRLVTAGVDPTLLVGAGFGEYHPVAVNETLEGRATNRRVSIVVVSPAEGSDPARTRLLGGGAEPAAGPAAPPASSPPNAASPAGALAH